MENARQLQCKALRRREKSRRRRNNGEQWKNNAQSNGNSRTSGRVLTSGCALRMPPSFGFPVKYRKITGPRLPRPRQRVDLHLSQSPANERAPARVLSCVPSMIDSLEVEVLYPA
jgi:hypothetical protein